MLYVHTARHVTCISNLTASSCLYWLSHFCFKLAFSFRRLSKQGLSCFCSGLDLPHASARCQSRARRNGASTRSSPAPGPVHNLHKVCTGAQRLQKHLHNLRASTIARICSSCLPAFSSKTWFLTERLATFSSNCSLGRRMLRWNKHLKSCSPQPKLAQRHSRPTSERVDYPYEVCNFLLRFDPGPSAILKRGGFTPGAS